jgi:hypothetical protein
MPLAYARLSDRRHRRAGLGAAQADADRPMRPHHPVTDFFMLKHRSGPPPPVAQPAGLREARKPDHQRKGVVAILSGRHVVETAEGITSAR